MKDEHAIGPWQQTLRLIAWIVVIFLVLIIVTNSTSGSRQDGTRFKTINGPLACTTGYRGGEAIYICRIPRPTTKKSSNFWIGG